MGSHSLRRRKNTVPLYVTWLLLLVIVLFVTPPPERQNLAHMRLCVLVGEVVVALCLISASIHVLARRPWLGGIGMVVCLAVLVVTGIRLAGDVSHKYRSQPRSALEKTTWQLKMSQAAS